MFYQYVLPGLLGLGGGIVGSLVAPWVNWAIEKRRQRTQHRREAIARWRKAFRFPPPESHEPEWVNWTSYRHGLEYQEIVAYMTEDQKAQVRNTGDAKTRQVILAFVSELERKWELT